MKESELQNVPREQVALRIIANSKGDPSGAKRGSSPTARDGVACSRKPGVRLEYRLDSFTRAHAIPHGRTSAPLLAQGPDTRSVNESPVHARNSQAC